MDEQARRSEVVFVRTSDGKTSQEATSYQVALRRARESLTEMIEQSNGVGWQHMFATVFRRRLALEVELARYVVDMEGRIRRRFPEVKVSPSQQVPEQVTAGGGRQLLLSPRTGRKRAS